MAPGDDTVPIALGGGVFVSSCRSGSGGITGARVRSPHRASLGWTRPSSRDWLVAPCPTRCVKLTPGVYYLPMCGGVSIMASRRQITTKTPSPAATIIISTSLCISAEQFNCLSRLVDKSFHQHSGDAPPIVSFGGASAATSRAFTGGPPALADWQVRRAAPRRTLRP